VAQRTEHAAVSSRRGIIDALPRGAATSAALLRIALGLVYLWAFVAQGFGVGYTNTNGAKPPSYGWRLVGRGQVRMQQRLERAPITLDDRGMRD
jgi:hypothetical protein